jgi:hypothetical protein
LLASRAPFNCDFYIEDFRTATEALNKASGGLLSSVDFYSPVGPFYFYVFALSAMIDSTPTASTVMHAGALFALIGCVPCVVTFRCHERPRTVHRVAVACVICRIVPWQRRVDAPGNATLPCALQSLGLVDFRRRVLITAATHFIVFYPVVDVGMHVGQRLQYRFNEADPAFAGTPYADLKFDPDIVRDERRRINTIPAGRAGILSGLEMRFEAGAKDPQAGSVATLAFSNPFPMLLGRPSPVGTPIRLSAGRNFSEDVFMSPEDLFEGVEFAMIEPGQGLLIDIYRATLETELEERSNNEFWTLLVRRKQ